MLSLAKNSEDWVNLTIIGWNFFWENGKLAVCNDCKNRLTNFEDNEPIYEHTASKTKICQICRAKLVKKEKN